MSHELYSALLLRYFFIFSWGNGRSDSRGRVIDDGLTLGLWRTVVGPFDPAAKKQWHLHVRLTSAAVCSSRFELWDELYI